MGRAPPPALSAEPRAPSLGRQVAEMEVEDRKKWVEERASAWLGELDWTPEDDRLFPPAARAAAHDAKDAAEEGWRVVIGDRRSVQPVLDVLETEVLRDHISMLAAQAAARAALA